LEERINVHLYIYILKTSTFNICTLHIGVISGQNSAREMRPKKRKKEKKKKIWDYPDENSISTLRVPPLPPRFARAGRLRGSRGLGARAKTLSVTSPCLHLTCRVVILLRGFPDDWRESKIDKTTDETDAIRLPRHEIETSAARASRENRKVPPIRRSKGEGSGKGGTEGPPFFFSPPCVPVRARERKISSRGRG